VCPQIRVFDLLGVRCRFLQGIWRGQNFFYEVVPALSVFRFTFPLRHVAYPKDDIRNELTVRRGVHILNQGRFEEGELLDPDRILSNDVEFFESNVVWSGMCGNLFPHGLSPMPSQMELKQLTLKPQAVGDTLEDKPD
jgi:hypothetical protein